MAEDPNLNIALDVVLRDRDDLYRCLMQVERKLKEMSDLQAMKDSYETRLSEKDKIIEAKGKAFEFKDNRIASLERKLKYLEMKVWRTMSERRRFPDNPNQLKLDFGEENMTPEEEEAIRPKLLEHLHHEEEHIYPEGYLGNEDHGYCLMKRKLPSILNINHPKCMSVLLRHKSMHKDTTGLSPLQ